MLIAGAIALSVASRRAELVLLALGPLLALAYSALAGAAQGLVALTTNFGPKRAPEGGSGRLAVTVRAESSRFPLAVCLRLDVPAGLRVRGGPIRRIWLEGGRPVNLEFTVDAEHRGIYDLGACHLVATAPGTLRGGEVAFPSRHAWEVLPRPILPSKLPGNARLTGVLPGPHRSRRTGSGVEFAGLREYTAGDPLKNLDWRASIRWQKWVVRQRLATRNAETVILLDALASKATGRANTFDACVRVAAGVAKELLAEGNRVGLVIYGGVLTWVRPESGRTQRWRLLRELRDAATTPTYAAKDLRVVPRRVLPPHAAVIAVSSLIDPGFVDVVGSLKARGWSVGILYVGPRSALTARSQSERLALRLLALDHRIRLDRLRERGIKICPANVPPVAPVHGPQAVTRQGALTAASRVLESLMPPWLAGGTALAALATIALLAPGCWLVAANAPAGGGMGTAAVLACCAISVAVYAILAAAALADGPGFPRAAGAPESRTFGLRLGVLALFRAMLAVGGGGLFVVGLGAFLTGTSGALWALLLAMVMLAGGITLVLAPSPEMSRIPHGSP